MGAFGPEANLKPHRIETFKFSTDPDLVAKVRDVVGLYLAPPERIQALDRTAPMLPMKPGQVERHTHDSPSAFFASQNNRTAWPISRGPAGAAGAAGPRTAIRI